MSERTGKSSAAAGEQTDERRPAIRDSNDEIVLNVGAGEHGDGDVTLDLLSSVDPDVQGTATALPFADETFDIIEMDQVLEHISPANLGDVFEECYRVLREDGRLEAWVPHAASRLYDQDPTHRSSWTYGTPEYFADGGFSWYYDDREFTFDLVDREVTVWVLEGAPLSGVRSVLLQTVHRSSSGRTASSIARRSAVRFTSRYGRCNNGTRYSPQPNIARHSRLAAPRPPRTYAPDRGVPRANPRPGLRDQHRDARQFPAIIGGEYASGDGLESERSVAHEFEPYSAGITTNHLLSAEYGYDAGFDFVRVAERRRRVTQG